MTPTDHTTPPAPAASYVAPTLTPLGTVASTTAGPDGDKTLDGLVGDDGGFRMDDDMTS